MLRWFDWLLFGFMTELISFYLPFLFSLSVGSNSKTTPLQDSTASIEKLHYNPISKQKHPCKSSSVISILEFQFCEICNIKLRPISWKLNSIISRVILKDCKTILHEADTLAKDASMKALFFFARELGKIITMGSHIMKPELRCDQC